MKGGRHRSQQGIIYPFDEETSEVNKKGYLTGVDLDSLVKNYQIIVMNHQPGIGKTHTVLDYIMKKSREDDNFSFFYFTDRHQAIKERLDKLKEDAKSKEEKRIIKKFGHWEGFGRHCTNETVDKLLEFNVPIDIIRKQVNVEEPYAKYEKQFKNIKRVFAPFNYLTNDYFKDNPPDIVFLDESITQLEKYRFDEEDIAKGLKLIKAPREYMENAGNKKFLWKKSVQEKIKNLYYETVITAIKKGKKRLDEYKIFNPHKLFEYLRWSRIYEYKINDYSLPLYYHALDVVTNNIPIVIMDATFNEHLFAYFLESYNGEMSKMRTDKFKGFEDLKVIILKSDATSNQTLIYRMHPMGAWPKASFTTDKDTTWPWLLEDLHQLRKIFGDANIGIITHKELCWLFESMNFDVEYYGALRGTNRLEKKLVLVIIGTWLPLPPSWEDDKESFDKNKDYIDYLAKKYFLTTIEKDDAIEVRAGAPLPIEGEFPQIYDNPDSKARIRMTVESKINTVKGLMKYFDSKYADKVAQHPLSMINTIWFDEIYQAFHRNRGLTHPRIIFAYGWFQEPKMSMRIGDEFLVPELLTRYDLRNEFISMKDSSEEHLIESDSVIKVMGDEDKGKIYDKYKQQHKGGLMQGLMKHIELEENVDDISKEFKIHKKGVKRGALTPPIKDLKDKYKNLKDLIEYKES